MNIQFTYNNDNYIVSALNSSTLAIQKNNNNVQFYKVKTEHGYTYKIQKTQVKANGGATGFVQHCKECIDNGPAWIIAPVVIVPLEKILETVKPCK